MAKVQPLETQPRDSRRTAVREFKRRLIQDAAKRIFVDHGIEAASMREIALAAGYSTGLIYAYFETKEALYAEILRDSLETLYDEVVAASRAKTTQRAVAALRGLWEFYAQRPADFDLGFYLHGGARPAGLTRDLDHELNARLDRVMTYIGECLESDGLVTARRAHHQAVVHVTSLFGLLLMTRTGRIKSVREEPGAVLTSFLRQVTAQKGAK